VLAVVALLAQLAVTMVTTAVEQTPTIDEPVYVATAEVYLKQHSLRYNPEHPPLGKLIIATGLVFTDAHLDSGFVGSQMALGRSVLYESGNDPERLMLWARLPVIVLTLLFGLVVLAFARDLTARRAGWWPSPCTRSRRTSSRTDRWPRSTSPRPASCSRRSGCCGGRGAGRTSVLPLAGVALGAAVATKMSMLARFRC
jgi:hypothetical protein